jgi:hypothetical protein
MQGDHSIHWQCWEGNVSVISVSQDTSEVDRAGKHGTLQLTINLPYTPAVNIIIYY